LNNTLSEEEKSAVESFLKKPLKEKINDIGRCLGVIKRPPLTQELKESLEELTGPLPEGFDWANHGKWPVSTWENLMLKDIFVAKRLSLYQECLRRDLVKNGASEAESRFIVRDSPFSYSLQNANLDDIVSEINDPKLTRTNSLAKNIG